MSGTSPKPRPPEARLRPGARRAQAFPRERGAEDAGPRPADLVAVGRVTDAYGLQGWVKVSPYNDPTQSVLRSIRRWWFDDGASAAVERARVHAASIVCKLAGIDDRDAALALKNHEVLVSRADFPRGADDEFYWVDLVGCRVTDRAGTVHGEVGAVDDYGAHPILKLACPDGRERLVPFAGDWIVAVDVAARTIVTDWPFEDAP